MMPYDSHEGRRHTAGHKLRTMLLALLIPFLTQCAADATDEAATPTPTSMPTPVATVPAPTIGDGCELDGGGEVTVLDETFEEKVELEAPGDGFVVDGRDGVSLTNGVRALEIGDDVAPVGGCVLGWSVFGQQSRLLSWREMHDDIGGSALRVYGSNYVVDGLRAENVEDAFDPRGGEGFEVRNMWVEYVRDDCIENDERRAGVVRDSLFDGCYTFFSEQDDGEVDGESLVFDGVLVRLSAMPGPRDFEDPTALGHGSLFKKFDKGERHEPVIRNSVFFLEQECNTGCKDWPPGTVASNVVLVWGGEGEFPMSVLPGMTLTQDRSVWDTAAASWKQRHGCTTIDQPCTALHTPTSAQS